MQNQGEMLVSLNTLLAILAIIVIPCIAFAAATIVKVAKIEVKVEIYKQISENTSETVDEKITKIETKMDKGFSDIHADLRKILNQHRS